LISGRKVEKEADMWDHIIDLGPEGGKGGGYVIGSGTPEKITKLKKSYTGKYLKEYLP